MLKYTLKTRLKTALDTALKTKRKNLHKNNNNNPKLDKIWKPTIKTKRKLKIPLKAENCTKDYIKMY